MSAKPDSTIVAGIIAAATSIAIASGQNVWAWLLAKLKLRKGSEQAGVIAQIEAKTENDRIWNDRVKMMMESNDRLTAERDTERENRFASENRERDLEAKLFDAYETARTAAAAAQIAHEKAQIAQDKAEVADVERAVMQVEISDMRHAHQKVGEILLHVDDPPDIGKAAQP
jgi:hypothetical protein